MPKYLDLTGLTTLKSKLDTTYAKKNDVYTKAQVDSAIAGAGIPTVTITQSQVISQDPVTQIQLTDEQYQILSDNKQVIIDTTAFGMGAVVADYAGTASGTSHYILFKFPFFKAFYLVYIDTSTKVAEIHFGTVTIAQIDIDGADADGKVATADYTQSEVKWAFPYRMSYLNTAPSSANNTGTIQIVVLSSEPATRYDGYFYIITESN